MWDCYICFWVDEITCPSCNKAPAHPHFQLRRFPQKKKQIVFCSHCGEVASIPLSRHNFTCASCAQKTAISKGIVQKRACTCPGCKTQVLMRDIRSNGQQLSQQLFALEVLPDGTKERIFKRAEDTDIALYKQASELWVSLSKQNGFVPSDLIPERNRDDRRPISLGYKRYRDLFNPRQLLYLSQLAAAISRVEDSQSRELSCISIFR